MGTSSKRNKKILDSCKEISKDIEGIQKEIERAYKKSLSFVEKNIVEAPFKFKKFSPKQKLVMRWWDMPKYREKDGIIADGSVRSGKTMSFSLSYVTWAMTKFNKKKFAIAGQSITSAMENIVNDLILMMLSLKHRKNKEKMIIKSVRVKKNKMIVHAKVNGQDRTNSFEIIGGKDEASYRLIQGRTYAGALVDEVVLMPKSFVDQLISRCSVEGRKLWFTCNPGGPFHWFKVNFIDRLKKMRMIRIHFTLDDNPSLAESIKEGYRRMFTGVFFKKYILGLWVAAEGLVYSMFSDEENVVSLKEVPECDEYYIAGDYGTSNPMAWGLFGILKKGRKKGEEIVYLIKEYHHSGRETRKKTDDQYADEFDKFYKACKDLIGKKSIKASIFDPSAASFKLALEQRRYRIKNAKNTVLNPKHKDLGIGVVANYIEKRLFKVVDSCINTLKEFYVYAYDEKALERGVEKTIEKWDHHMDKIRYLFNTAIMTTGGKVVSTNNYMV